MATLLKDLLPVARKEHICPICGHVIQPGERYHRQSVADYGTAYDVYECMACHNAMKLLLEYWEYEDFNVEGFFERVWDVLEYYMPIENIKKMTNHEQILELLKHEKDILDDKRKWRNEYGEWR